MNRKFRGDRLKKARQYRGKTITELAALTGISKQSLSLYENGTMPDYERVFKIATELHFPYEYFMHEDSNPVKAGVTYFIKICKFPFIKLARNSFHWLQ